MPLPSICISGANGFIGNNLSNFLNVKGYPLIKLVRGESLLPVFNSFKGSYELNITSNTDWASLLDGVDICIHTAGRVHVMHDIAVDPLTEFRSSNLNGTLNFAQSAMLAGVKRFIFISTVKVNGEVTCASSPFTENDTPHPKDNYALSKFEAELALMNLSNNSDMEVVIIRPPLVYGPNVKGNFSNLINLINKGTPLPFGSINNRRSLVSIDNLVNLIFTCLDHPAAANQVFLVSDGEDLSTTNLLRGVAKAAGAPSRLIPLPASVLMFVASLLGKRAIAQRLLCSLQVDISKARDLLGWKPPISIEEGLRRCFELPTEKDAHH